MPGLVCSLWCVLRMVRITDLWSRQTTWVQTEATQETCQMIQSLVDPTLGYTTMAARVWASSITGILSSSKRFMSSPSLSNARTCLRYHSLTLHTFMV